MRLVYAVISDFALISADGKPTIVGVFDTIRARNVPFAWARLAFAARLEFESHEAGVNRTVQIIIRDPSGGELGRAGGPFTLKTPLDASPRIMFDPHMIFDGFVFQAFGIYTISLEVDGVPLASVSLTIQFSE